MFSNIPMSDNLTSKQKIKIQIKKRQIKPVDKLLLVKKNTCPIINSNIHVISFCNNKIIHDAKQSIERFDPNINANYYHQFLDLQSIAGCVAKLEEVPFLLVEYNKYGKLRRTPRQTYCYGQYNSELTAKYRGQKFQTEPIPDWLNLLKGKIEKMTNREYNAVILNKYVDGNQHISWHADSEPFLDHQMIASLTFGEERAFQFRKDRGDIIHEISLKSGSLLIFDEGLLHCLPKRKNINGTRYNITFRCVQNSLGIGNYYFYNRGQTQCLSI